MKQRISCFLVALLISTFFAAEAQPPTSGWVVLDNFSDGNFTSNPQWNVVTPSDPWIIKSGAVTVNSLNGSFALSTPFTRVVDAWDFDYVMDGGFAGQILDYFFFMTGASNDPRNASGYRVRYQLGNTANVVSLQTVTNGVAVNTIATFNNGLTNSLPKITITRKNNIWEFYVGSTLRGTGTDATYSNSICAYQGLYVFKPNSSVPYDHGFDNIRYREIPFGPFASAVFLGTCRQPAGSFFNTTGAGANLIDQNNKTFTDTFFGTYIQNSGALVLKGAEVKTFKGTNANVCIPRMYYRIIPQGVTPGAFSDTALSNIIDNCSGTSFPTGGPCNDRDQKWQRNDMSLDLTAFPPGNYTFQVYYEISGSASSLSGCGDTIILNNSGNFYNSTFIIQATPSLTSTNPTTCSGTNGTITIKGSAPNTKYAVTYKDDGVTIGPDSLTSNASGDIVITGLNAGTYTSFSISNACTIPVNGTIILSDPAFSITPSSTPNTVCNGTSGNTTPCTYTGPKVVINEIMVMPGVTYGPGADDISATFQSLYTGREWVELHNPSPCDAVDISCYILGDKSSPTSSGAISFPQGTIIPPLGFLVVGGSNAPNVNIIVNNLRSTPNFTGTSNWRFNNISGSCALYDKSLQLVDGIYWGPSQNDINDRVNAVGDAFEYTLPFPAGVGCNYPSAAIIPAPKDNAAQFEYIGNVASTSVGALTIGKSTYRSTDAGGTWIVGGVGAAKNTPGNCNGTCAPPFPGGGTIGTCDGSVSVVVAGAVGTISYEWKDGSNNIVGTTSGVTNLCAGTYTVKVTDNTTTCTKTASVTVTDNIPQVTPIFTQVPAICSGGTFTLPTTSTNNITGSWSPAIDNTQTKTYTFTPDPGQCATTASMTVNVTPSVTPLFTQVPAICSGGTFTLPTTSTNNITGSWSPAIDNTQTKTYTFTPDPGQCASSTTMTVNVTTTVNPTFSFSNSISICNGKNIPVLPVTSDNNVSGTWNPLVISATQSGTYVFTPAAGQCATSFTLNVTATALTFSTTSTPNTVCNGTGGNPTPCTYSGPPVLINEVMFMPGQNYSTSITPTPDNLARELQSMYDNNLKKGKEWVELYNPSPCDAVDVSCYILGSQTTSSNGAAFSIPQGTVIPPLGFLVIGGGDVSGVDFNLNNYIGTPNLSGGSRWFLENGCGYILLSKPTGEVLNAVYWSQIDANDLTASTSCGSNFSRSLSTPSVCGTSVSLPAARDITGIEYAGNWGATAQGPNVIGKTISRSQDGGLTWVLSGTGGTIKACNSTCAPPYNGGTTGSTCNGGVSVTAGGGSGNYTYEWRNSSNNVIGSGTSVSSLCAGTYSVKVTDQTTNCDSTIIVTVVDNIPQITPSFNTYGPFCQGDILPTVTLPETSNNGIKGTWNPSSLSSAVAGDISYTFTPDPNQCADPVTITVKVNPKVTPTFPYGTSLTVCSGDPTPNLQAISTNNVIGLWNPANVSNTQSDVYTFTPAPGSCATTATFAVTVIQRPNVTVRPDTTIYHNAVYPGDIFSGLPSGSTVSWTNSNTSIGLPASGTGNVPAFTAINIGSNPVTATITVNSTNGNCAGTVRTYKITVLPLNRDVFVPNVFTPNGDAKNDQLLVYGNYITKLEMRIFNQWGELVKVINNPSVGWDGTHKGKPQPVGVYVYTLRATLADGTEVNKKGSITLLR